jgi:hypothetical protein
MIRRSQWRGFWLGAGITACALSATAIADINVSGSAFVDYWYESSATARGNSLPSITPEAALKVEVDVHESLSFSAKMCFGCHGVEIDRAHIDFTPFSFLNIQAGRIGIPFGDFAVRYDHGSHRTVSKPLMYEMGRMAYYGRSAFNLGVIPQPYVDTGAVVYGQVWFGDHVQLWYGGYAVAGLKGDNDFEFQSMHMPYYTDNNRSPAGGGRMVVTLSGSGTTFFRDFSLGVSGMHGRYDPDNRLKYTAVGADSTLRLGPLTLRGEVALMRVDIDPTAPGYRYQIIDPYFEKGGFFVELEHPVGPNLLMVYRADGLRRVGIPLPQSMAQLSPDSRILRYTQGVQLLLADSFFAKLSYEYWWLSDFPRFHTVHLGIGGTY